MMAIGFALTPASAAGTSGGTTSSEGAPVSLSGEVIDTWCHFSGVMGAGEAVQGTAHHTCALWCAAGGIPVGVLADDGTVYTLLKWKDQDPLTKTEAILDVQSNRISVTGALHQRDGINYLIVEEVTANEGIVNKTHEIFGVTPHFAIPEPDQK
jgi:hypothetical protein